MTEKVLPTITLAKLYESQKQLIHALVVYKNINGLRHSEELILKIEELKDAIFAENSAEYPDSVNLLFSIKERKHLNILPHIQALAYKDAVMQYHSSLTQHSQAPLKEEIIQPEPSESKDQKIISEILLFMETLKNTDISNISEIAPDKELQDLTLAEIKELLEEIEKKKKIHLDLNLKESKTIL